MKCYVKTEMTCNKKKKKKSVSKIVSVMLKQSVYTVSEYRKESKNDCFLRLIF